MMPAVNGWCPGALRPMRSGDGLIVRIRQSAGVLPLAKVLAIATAAREYGNGEIDLTRRANLQIRGVGDATHAPLLAHLSASGLIDASVAAEAVRNVMTSPLAGADDHELIDVRPLARELERRLGCEPALWRLPGKFGFLLDGSGVPSLVAERGDIRLSACETHVGVMIAVGVDRPGAARILGWVVPDAAVAAAIAIARHHVEREPGSPFRRLRDLSEDEIDDFRAVIADKVATAMPPGGEQQRRTRIAASDKRWLGVRPLDDGRAVVGVAAAFGRLSADSLAALGGAAIASGCRAMRVSPWRSLYIVADDAGRAAAVAACASRLGLITDTDDPLLAIDACPGAPACTSATVETRRTARALAEISRELAPLRSFHVSGCAKGCARSARADVVLTARGDRFAVIRNGRASDGGGHPTIAPRDVCELPRLLAGLREQSRPSTPLPELEPS